MSLETLVPYLVENNTTIVSGLVLSIIALSVFLGFRGFVSAKDAEKFQGADTASLGQLEETIKKLLEKANQVPTAASMGGTISAENTELLKEIEDLKNSLAERQVQIELLERKTAENPESEAGPGMTKVEKEAMQSQVKDLQARLAEYEIISEDIADLSFFREENVKLQKELEALKKGGAASAPAAPAVSAAEPAAVSAAPQAAPPVAEAAKIEEPPVQAAVIPEPPESDSALPDVGQDMVDRLLEQAGSISRPAEPSAIGSSADLDVEKMVAEAAVLGSTPVEEPVNALEGSLDPDKLLAEAAGMDGKINPEDAKLMGEFEDFMRKGGVG